MSTRRRFLQNLSSSALLIGAGGLSKLMAEEHYETRIIPWERKFSSNDKVRIAVIGGGDRSVVRYIGSEGVMEKGDGIKINYSIMPKATGIGGWDSLTTYPQAMQDELMKRYGEKWSADDKKEPTKQSVQYKAPEGNDEHLEHFTNFFEGVRNNKPVIEDPIIGFRAAAPCLAANASYEQKKIIYWDPEKMKVAKE